jgi:hypothetical protein
MYLGRIHGKKNIIFTRDEAETISNGSEYPIE